MTDIICSVRMLLKKSDKTLLKYGLRELDSTKGNTCWKMTGFSCYLEANQKFYMFSSLLDDLSLALFLDLGVTTLITSLNWSAPWRRSCTLIVRNSKNECIFLVEIFIFFCLCCKYSKLQIPYRMAWEIHGRD